MILVTLSAEAEDFGEDVVFVYGSGLLRFFAEDAGFTFVRHRIGECGALCGGGVFALSDCIHEFLYVVIGCTGHFIACVADLGEDRVRLHGSTLRRIFTEDAGLSFCEAGVGHSASNVLFLAGAHSSADFLRVEPAFGGLFFADAMDFGEDGFGFHNGDCGRISSGLQMTGQVCPAAATRCSMRRRMFTLLMCLQFHVSRKSMP